MTDDVARVHAFSLHWAGISDHLDPTRPTEPDLSRAEARVVHDLHLHGPCRRRAVRDRLAIDASFLTRVLRRLGERGLVASSPSHGDGRALDVELTAVGAATAVELARRPRERIAELLDPLTDEQRASAVEAMAILTHVLRPPAGPSTSSRTARTVSRGAGDADVVVRGLRPGDLGWIAGRNGAVYADEFGWGDGYEALCAEIVADFDRHLDPARERGFVVEIDGGRAGCALLRRRTDDEAQIRLVLVERWARGHGLGTLLVDECLRFARDAGYGSVMLWTNDVLTAARRIYESAGFALVEETPHHSFGHDLVGQVWSREL